MFRLSLLLAALLGYGLAILVPGSERRGVEPLLRDLSRPLVLPSLWASLEESQDSGRYGETAAKGRVLMRYLPGWVDGSLYFAWLLASPRPGREETPQASLGRLLAALQWLDQAVADLNPENPSKAAEILLAQAFFVEVRTVQDPRLETALKAEVGHGSAEVAAGYVDRAIALAPSQAKADRRIMLYPKLIAGALRMGNRQRAIDLIETALDKFQQVSDRGLAVAWSNSLRRFRAFLDGDLGMSLQDLAEDPYLSDIIQAYRAGQN